MSHACKAMLRACIGIAEQRVPEMTCGNADAGKNPWEKQPEEKFKLKILQLEVSQAANIPSTENENRILMEALEGG